MPSSRGSPGGNVITVLDAHIYWPDQPAELRAAWNLLRDDGLLLMFVLEPRGKANYGDDSATTKQEEEQLAWPFRRRSPPRNRCRCGRNNEKDMIIGTFLASGKNCDDVVWPPRTRGT